MGQVSLAEPDTVIFKLHPPPEDSSRLVDAQAQRFTRELAVDRPIERCQALTSSFCSRLSVDKMPCG
ncbi:hypothetical protein [Burkholderia gladioli]|uniref:hypothetical protein n=1 Tax=Burkholderia gladioli TaxID=28095 RepID=UPI0013F631E5|nr:hypothetical protein [Burkholderia gladioli]